MLCIAHTAGYNPLFCRTWHCGFQYDTYSMVYQGGRQCIHVNVLFAWNVLQRELRMMARNGVWIRRTQPQEHDLLLIHGILHKMCMCSCCCCAFCSCSQVTRALGAAAQLLTSRQLPECRQNMLAAAELCQRCALHDSVSSRTTEVHMSTALQQCHFRAAVCVVCMLRCVCLSCFNNGRC